MTLPERPGHRPGRPEGARPRLWGESAPAWLWGGLLAAGSLATALAVRFWLLAGAAVSAQAAVIPSAAFPPERAPISRPAQAPAPPLHDSLPVAAESPSARDCPPLFPVRFGIGSDTPVFDAAGLDGLAAWLLSHPHTLLVIDGHADAIGSADGNFELSRRRAEAVAARFVSAGLPPSRIMRRAFGKFAPLPGIPEASARNRRAALSVGGTTPCPDRGDP